MKKTINESKFLFVLYVCTVHVVTYFIMGMIASGIFNYGKLFTLPVIADYYRPIESVSALVGPFIQILRGLIFGLVLLPFANRLEESKYGWFFLWMLFVGIGILGTPAAAPSSVEGVIYTKLPVWFHLIGLPEITIQTLIFSVVVHRKLCSIEHPITEKSKRLLESISVACFAFIGYTVVSILFALASRVKIDTDNMDFKVLGQFAAPLLLIFAVTASGKNHLVVKHVVLYLASAVVLAVYQAFILGSVGFVYILVAPILPAVISYFLNSRKQDA